MRGFSFSADHRWRLDPLNKAFSLLPPPASSHFTAERPYHAEEEGKMRNTFTLMHLLPICLFVCL